MKIFVVVFAIFLIGVNSSLLEDEHKQVLHQIRNVCVLEAGLNPYEIGNIIRAVRPAKKLVNASKCAVKRIIELREENEAVNDLVNRTKVALTNVLPRVVNDLAASCENLLGPEACGQVVDLVAVIVDSIQRQRNSLLRQ